jgi:MFS family permease
VRTSLTGVLRSKDYRLLLAGVTVSQAGDTAMFIVLAIWAVELTRDLAAGGLVFFTLSIPALVAPLGGLLIDKVATRTLLIWLDLATGTTVLSLLAVAGHRIWLLYAVTFLYGLAGMVSNPARLALVAEVTAKGGLGQANGLLQSGREATRLLAPLIGAGAYTLGGPQPVIVADAGTFLVSAACSCLIQAGRAAHASPPEAARGSWRRQALAGWSYLHRQPVLRRFVLASAVALLFAGMSEALIFAVVEQGLRLSPAFVGVTSSVQGGGAILAGLITGRVLTWLGDVKTMTLGFGLMSAGFLLTLTSSAGLVLAGMAIIGAGLTLCVVSVYTAIGARVPPYAIGRAATVLETCVTTPQTVSIAIGSALVTAVNYHVLLLSIAGALAVSMIITATAPGDAAARPASPGPPPEPRRAPPEPSHRRAAPQGRRCHGG